jgi:hypothetical protein
VSSALLDHAIHSRQPKPAAFAHFLRSEEWLENARSGSFIHPDAVIADGQHDIPAWSHRVPARKRLIDIEHCRLDNELSAMGHSVASIHGEIHDDLVHLSGVGLDNRHRRSRQQNDFNVVPHQRCQQLVDFPEPLIQVEHLLLHRLASAERQQLAGECGTTFCCFADIVDVLGATGIYPPAQ